MLGQEETGVNFQQEISAQDLGSVLSLLKVKVAQSCPTLCDPMDFTVHGVLQARILEWVVAFPFSRGLPNPGIKPRSPALQADSLPAEPQGRLKNTGVGRLSLPQVDHGAGHSSASSPLRVPGWSQGVAAFPSRGLTCREGLFPGSHRGQSLPRSCRTQPLPGCWLEAVFSSCNLVS